ncbi:MAG: hypothetical protein ABR886_10815, partial [Dehalococcoidales bacterium]
PVQGGSAAEVRRDAFAISEGLEEAVERLVNAEAAYGLASHNEVAVGFVPQRGTRRQRKYKSVRGKPPAIFT